MAAAKIPYIRTLNWITQPTFIPPLETVGSTLKQARNEALTRARLQYVCTEEPR